MLEYLRQFQSKTDQSLSSIYAKKFFFNLTNDISKRGTYYGDFLLPINEECYQKDFKSEFDLIFVQGSASHPLRIWNMSREKQINWPNVLLK